MSNHAIPPYKRRPRATSEPVTRNEKEQFNASVTASKKFGSKTLQYKKPTDPKPSIGHSSFKQAPALSIRNIKPLSADQKLAKIESIRQQLDAAFKNISLAKNSIKETVTNFEKALNATTAIKQKSQLVIMVNSIMTTVNSLYTEDHEHLAYFISTYRDHSDKIDDEHLELIEKFFSRYNLFLSAIQKGELAEATEHVQKLNAVLDQYSAAIKTKELEYLPEPAQKLFEYMNNLNAPINTCKQSLEKITKSVNEINISQILAPINSSEAPQPQTATYVPTIIRVAFASLLSTLAGLLGITTSSSKIKEAKLHLDAGLKLLRDLQPSSSREL